MPMRECAAATGGNPPLGESPSASTRAAGTKRRTLAASTMQNYRRHIEEHLLPAFEDKPIADILSTDINAWEKRERAVPYAASSVKTWQATLHLILADAVEEGLRDSNPATKRRGRGSRAGRSRNRGPEKPVTDALGILLMAERAALLSARDDEFIAIILMADTGMRWGEIVGLETDYAAPGTCGWSGSCTSSTLASCTVAHPRMTLIGLSTSPIGWPACCPTTLRAPSRSPAIAMDPGTSSAVTGRPTALFARSGRGSSMSPGAPESPREPSRTSSTARTRCRSRLGPRSWPPIDALGYVRGGAGGSWRRRIGDGPDSRHCSSSRPRPAGTRRGLRRRRIRCPSSRIPGQACRRGAGTPPAALTPARYRSPRADAARSPSHAQDAHGRAGDAAQADGRADGPPGRLRASTLFTRDA